MGNAGSPLCKEKITFSCPGEVFPLTEGLLMGDPISWIQKSLKRWPIKEAPLNIQVSIKSRQLDLPYQDPADRFIGATALIYDLTLMTMDERLISAPCLPTLR